MCSTWLHSGGEVVDLNGEPPGSLPRGSMPWRVAGPRATRRQRRAGMPTCSAHPLNTSVLTVAQDAASSIWNSSRTLLPVCCRASDQTALLQRLTMVLTTTVALNKAGKRKEDMTVHQRTRSGTPVTCALRKRTLRPGVLYGLLKIMLQA